MKIPSYMLQIRRAVIVCFLAMLPMQLSADYAPDGISALWWTARTEPAQLPDAVLALTNGWTCASSDDWIEWLGTVPLASFPDPVLVLANSGGGRVEVLLDGALVYGFGELRPGIAGPQAANAVHWVSLPRDGADRALRIRIYAARQGDLSVDGPMLLYAASTPLLRVLLRAAAGRIALALLFVFVGGYAVVAWAVRRRYGVPFSPWFAFLTLSLGLALLVAAVMEFLPPDVASRIYYAGLLLMLLFPVALWRFMEASLGPGPGRMIRRCWQLQLLVAVVLWLPDLLGLRAFTAVDQLIGNSVLALQLVVGAWLGAHHVRAATNTAAASQRWVALGILVLSLSGLIDIAGALLVGDPRFELYPLGALALVMLLAYDQERVAGEAQRQLRRQAEMLRRHQTHLEEQVESRTVQLRESMKAAQAASRAKSEFLANMSHELRTPLNAILGHAQLLRRDNLASSKIRERGDVILHSGEYLLALINDVLDLARIEAGRLEITIDEVDLHGLLQEVVSMLAPRAEQKALAFSFSIPSGLPARVAADGRRIRQILLNLIGNAIKFTEKGYVRLEVASRDNQLWFSVFDTGPGLSPEDTMRIFASFEQGSCAIGQEGTGLGLSISRSLARKMGGEVGVDSAPGAGSRFWFRLPCRIGDGHALTSQQDENAVPAPASPAHLPDHLGPDYRILLDAARIGDLATVLAETVALRDRHPEHAAILDTLKGMAESFEVQRLQAYLSLPDI